MPQTAPVTAQRTPVTTKLSASLPHAKDLKNQWNQQVCSSTGNAAFDQAFADCALR
jgi:hypothetical protein